MFGAKRHENILQRGSTQVLVQSGDSILSCDVAPHLAPPRGMMLILTSLTNFLGAAAEGGETILQLHQTQ